MKTIRDARPADAPALARLWHSGWQDAHAAILPKDLARHRTPESFARRMEEAIAQVRVVEDGNGPVGFAMIKGDELYQFYVASEARGTGAAQALMADALARFRTAGVATAWLACAIGNARAARFYEKMGWERVGVRTSILETPEGPFPLDIWRYEISLQA